MDHNAGVQRRDSVALRESMKGEAMTREKALALYHPVRASIRRILNAAVSVCTQSDFMRGAKQLGLWADGKISLPEGDQAAEMLGDVALFEPNQRGRRAFDVFLAAKALQLDAVDRGLAQRMGKAFFSLFRCSARHEVAGVWLEDVLDGGRKVWLMDERMESAASTEGAFGMRLFDAGEFHVGFGIIVPSDDETTGFAIQGMTQNGRTPFRHSLAGTLYGDKLGGGLIVSPELERAFMATLAELIDPRPHPRRVTGARPAGQAARKGKRK